jgi:hypothetical protein
MKIVLMNDQGEVIDTYEDVCVEDFSSKYWQGVIWEWLGRAARQYVNRFNLKVKSFLDEDKISDSSGVSSIV